MNKQIHNIHQKINVTNIIQDGKPLTPPSTPPKPNKPAPAQNKHMSSFMQQLG
ncbi:MAG TPA: hypothetical protein PLD02_12085 [Saprospiraceae bacterium]|nr:hypothetical protein [Saprospiraceae bacterium]